jgi:CelD/BcsL family acetyltransferase involved in cellulose biosynthesis
MHVEPVTTEEALAGVAGDWDGLSRGVPFRGGTWLRAWWRYYGQSSSAHARRELCALAVRDEQGALIGLAPWFVEYSMSAGRVIKFLGGDEIYSDYLSLLARPGHESPVADCVAAWLMRDFAAGWDALALSGVDAADLAVGALVDRLQSLGARVHRRPDLCCWRLELPRTWEEYLTLLSKSHRKQIRRAERRLFATGRAVVESPQSRAALEPAIDLLITLHQRRHQRQRRRGAFSSPSFARFHREVIPALVAAGQARLDVLRLDGVPLAVEYQLLGDDVVYAYQSGIDPDWLRLEPGRLAMMTAIRAAIAQGKRAFDFLRGDEPYKAHWRATPRATLRARVVPTSRAARLRNTIWLAGDTTKAWLRGRLKNVAQTANAKTT